VVALAIAGERQCGRDAGSIPISGAVNLGATLGSVPDMRSLMSDDNGRRFDQLFDEHRRAVLAYALRRVDDPTDAADVLAETFLLAWRRLDDVPTGADAKPWLLAVARRVLSNQRRGARRRIGLADRLAQELLAYRPPAPTESDLLVRRALAGLSEADREVLLLSAWEGLTPAEIGAVVGVRAVSVRSRLHRARRRLRSELEELGWDRAGRAPAALDVVQERTR
jgi:RNA polymerase sigma-70 factor (ECF subfamily)